MEDFQEPVGCSTLVRITSEMQQGDEPLTEGVGPGREMPSFASAVVSAVGHIQWLADACFVVLCDLDAESQTLDKIGSRVPRNMIRR